MLKMPGVKSGRTSSKRQTWPFFHVRGTGQKSDSDGLFMTNLSLGLNGICMQDLVGKISGSANDAAGKAKGAAGDAAGSAKGAASEAKGKASSVANNSSLNFITMLDLPSPQVCCLSDKQPLP